MSSNDYAWMGWSIAGVVFWVLVVVVVWKLRAPWRRPSDSSSGCSCLWCGSSFGSSGRYCERLWGEIFGDEIVGADIHRIALSPLERKEIVS